VPVSLGAPFWVVLENCFSVPNHFITVLDSVVALFQLFTSSDSELEVALRFQK
jgi:hypothetical protein